MGGPRSSPPRIAASACVIAALALFAACRQPQQPGNVQEPSEQPAPEIPAMPRLESLDRTAILAAVAQAASAHAAGADDLAAQRRLDGRQFEFRIRFGCRGPSNDLPEQGLGWSRDPERGTLRVRAKPTLTGDDPLVQELGGARFEAVEGFWIPRPWLLQPVCPVAAAVQAAVDEVAEEDAKVAEPIPRWPRIGIAQFYSETDPRTGRRSMRSYEAVKTMKPGQPIGSQGFDLVLSGRMKALPDKRVIACSAKGAQSPPDCIISADFDRVWIEASGSEEVIAEWTIG
ncbi:MAG: hypothetical protein ABI454_12580 [Sphingomicrobium sp.]